jgi:hypothetical protein
MNEVAAVPYIASKNVSSLHPIQCGSFLIMHTAMRVYIGEVLDLYKPSSGRHGSVPFMDKASTLSYLSLRCYLEVKMTVMVST